MIADTFRAVPPRPYSDFNVNAHLNEVLVLVAVNGGEVADQNIMDWVYRNMHLCGVAASHPMSFDELPYSAMAHLL